MQLDPTTRVQVDCFEGPHDRPSAPEPLAHDPVHVVDVGNARVSYVVNNVATQVEGLLLDTSTEDWQMLERVSVHSAFWGSKYAIAAMMRLGVAGSVVNFASVLGVTAEPLLPAYTASKHAALGLSRAIGTTREYARLGVRANVVCPADMETPVFQQYLDAYDDPDAARRQVASAYPIERIGDPAEVAAVVVFLVSAESSYVSGTALVVDGGLTAFLYTNG